MFKRAVIVALGASCAIAVISTVTLEQTPKAKTHRTTKKTKKTKKAAVETTTTTSPPSPSSVVVRHSARADGLLGLRNQKEARRIRQSFGKKALWAFDPATGHFRSTVNFTVPHGATLYVAAKTEALYRQLSTKHHKSAEAPTATATTVPSATSATSASSASTGETAQVSSGALEPLGVGGSWNLVMDDEFNGSSLNTSLWTPYWFSNGQSSNDTTMESSNVSVSGGDLNLTLDGTGGLVSTNPDDDVAGHTGFQFTHGFVEVRAYLPASGSQVANWPAIWTDGQSWPTDGELDIMEGLGGSACFHFHDPSGAPGGCASGNFTGWHTYGANWQDGLVTFYYDGNDVGTVTSGITSDPMYLILENSGGSYGGPSVQPSTMKIDYVRVWQS